MNLWIVIFLLIVVIALLSFIIYLNYKESDQDSESRDSLRDLDQAVERQQATLGDLSKDIQSFQDPLSKLNRYYQEERLLENLGSGL